MPAEAVVALIAGFFGLATIWLQAKVHADNRHDHAQTAEVVAATAAKVDQLIDGQQEIKADVIDIKADVRDHGARLRAIESVTSPKPAPRPRKKAAS